MIGDSAGLTETVTLPVIRFGSSSPLASDISVIVNVVVCPGSTGTIIGLVFPSNGIVPFIIPEKGPVPVTVIIRCARSILQMVSSPAWRDNTADLVWLQSLTIT